MLNVKLAVQIEFNVLYGNNLFFADPHKRSKYSAWAESRNLNVNLVVYIVTNGL